MFQSNPTLSKWNVTFLSGMRQALPCKNDTLYLNSLKFKSNGVNVSRHVRRYPAERISDILIDSNISNFDMARSIVEMVCV